MAAITLSQFNQQYHVMRAPLNQDADEFEPKSKKQKIVEQEDIVDDNDINSIDYNWEVDFILKNA